MQILVKSVYGQANDLAVFLTRDFYLKKGKIFTLLQSMDDWGEIVKRTRDKDD